MNCFLTQTQPPNLCVFTLHFAHVYILLSKLLKLHSKPKKLKKFKKKMHNLLIHWVPIFISWWPLWTAGEEKGQVRQNPEGFVIEWDDVVFHHLSQSQNGLQPILGWCHFSFHFTLHSSTPFSSWSLWPQSTWSDVPLRCNECWVSGYISSRLSGWIMLKDYFPGVLADRT